MFLNSSGTVSIGRSSHSSENVTPMTDSDHPYEYDLVVLGGGSGGLACSKAAAELGKKVAVLDFVKPSPPGTTWGLGGTCVNVGCIPKKLMHFAATLGESTRDATSYGWNLGSQEAQFAWEKLVEGVQDHIGSLNWGYRVQLREKKVNYLNSLGSFIDAHTIQCVDKKGNQKNITANHIAIAVGGRPRYPSIPGAREYGITSDDLFSLPTPPGKTLVVGASYVALECAGFLAGVGFDATVMMRSIPLRGFDQQMGEMVCQYMEEHAHVKFLRGAVPEKIELTPEGKKKVFYNQKGEVQSGEYDTVLFAIGRDPDVQGLNIANAGIKLHQSSGKILVNDEERTSQPNIFAIGDVIHGGLELTPVAIMAGKLLAQRLYAGGTQKMHYDKVPTTVFTPLEYGCCGLPEEVAIERYGEESIEVYHSYFKPLEWTVSHKPDNVCYMKLICLKSDNNKVVGFHVLAPNAGEITQGIGVAMRMGATKSDFDHTVGIHPTIAEEMTTLTKTKSSGEDAKKDGC